jgi:hypothetical protein
MTQPTQPTPQPSHIPPFQRVYILALLLILAGAITGCVPRSSQGHDCGSAWFAQTDEAAQEADDLAGAYGVPREAADCDAARAGTRNMALMLLGGGVVLLAVGWVMSGRRPEEG